MQQVEFNLLHHSKGSPEKLRFLSVSWKSEPVAETDREIQVIHVEADAVEIFFEDGVRGTGQVGINRQVAVCLPLGAELASPVETA